MACTVALRNTGYLGSQRIAFFKVTSDATTGTVYTSFQYINGCAVGLSSGCTWATKVIPNATADGTACTGALGFYGALSSQVMYLTVWGS